MLSAPSLRLSSYWTVLAVASSLSAPSPSPSSTSSAAATAAAAARSSLPEPSPPRPKAKIAWFRPHALRVRDNDALRAAFDESSPSSVLPLYLWSAPPPRPGRDGTDCPAPPAPVDPATGGTASDVFVARCLGGLNRTLGGRLALGLVEEAESSSPLGGGDAAAEAEAAALADELARAASALRPLVVDVDDAAPPPVVEAFYLESHDAALEGALRAALSGRGVVPRPFPGGYALLDYGREPNLGRTMREIVEGHPFRSPLIPFVDYLLKRLEREPPPEPRVAPASEEMERTLVRDGGAGTFVSRPIAAERLVGLVGRTGSGRTDWGASVAEAWPAAEDDAHTALSDFLSSLSGGGSGQDSAAVSTAKRTHLASRLSPYLARGVLSARQVYRALTSSDERGGRVPRRDAAASFVRRICWRDYTYAASALFPDAVRGGRPIREGYEGDDDADDEDSSDDSGDRPSSDLLLRRWKDGSTGFPLVDAGMRQLASEGWMPQKVRLAASTCLVEGLGVRWRHGMDHFAEYLTDYDPCINAHMWMNAGSVGFDPYYVGSDYKGRPYWDGDGAYVRRWCPELARLPDYVEVDPPVGTGAGGTNRVDCLYQPWLAPAGVLRDAGVALGAKAEGGTYPQRACDEREGRRRFYGRLRERRARWPPGGIDECGRDVVPMGRSPTAERVGMFTPRALVSKPSQGK